MSTSHPSNRNRKQPPSLRGGRRCRQMSEVDYPSSKKARCPWWPSAGRHVRPTAAPFEAHTERRSRWRFTGS